MQFFVVGILNSASIGIWSYERGEASSLDYKQKIKINLQ